MTSAPAWTPYDRNCPSRGLLDRIGDRWTVLIIGALEDGPRRFSDLQRDVDGVSQKMLSQTLRSLQRDGLVVRSWFAEVPPRVEYDLTPLGRSLLGPLRTLETWATGHMSDVLAARERYDAEQESTGQDSTGSRR